MLYNHVSFLFTFFKFYLARSPVFSHVSASLDGLTTIRAHQSQNICLDVFQEYLDVNTSARYLVLALSYWFISWLDLIGAFYVACVTFTCVSLRNGLCIDKIYLHKN